MTSVTGTLKPMKPGTPFSFLVRDDGGPDIYVNFADIGVSSIEEVFGYQLVVLVEQREKGLVATSLLKRFGVGSPLPGMRQANKPHDGEFAPSTNVPPSPSSAVARSTNAATSARPAIRPLSGARDSSPGRILMDWANISLSDHVAETVDASGQTRRREYKSCLPDLHAMLLKGEEWDFAIDRERGQLKILGNYLRFTFFRLQQEQKIALSHDGKIAVINTGLVDNLFEPIYGVFESNSPGMKRPFTFKAFCCAGRGVYGKRILAPFERLPDRAEFFSSINDVILPRDIEVVEQWEHIIDDGVVRGRYPFKFLKKYVPDNTVLTIKDLKKLMERVSTILAVY